MKMPGRRLCSFLLCVALGWVASLAHGANALPNAASTFPVNVPRVIPGHSVVFVSVDYRNGGAMGVFRGLSEAAHAVGWKVTALDGQGSMARICTLLAQPRTLAADAVVLGGFDPDTCETQLRTLRQRNVVLVGWHAGSDAHVPGLYFNVATSPIEVARLALAEVMRDALERQRPVGVVIFNDGRFDIANAKTQAMADGVTRCAPGLRCELLAVVDVPISDAAQQMPQQVQTQLARWGERWTYAMAINDVYFDHMEIPLQLARRKDLANVAAGDGSVKALSRVRSGRAAQIATIGEPLDLQGYQLLDEIQRALNGSPPSGFIQEPLVLNTRSLQHSGGNPSREALKRWYHDRWLK
ncbi:type 1 periplasmic-binding domain-containing protein [Hydrogenophaga soli]